MKFAHLLYDSTAKSHKFNIIWKNIIKLTDNLKGEKYV